jgi:hypothetical protein
MMDAGAWSLDPLIERPHFQLDGIIGMRRLCRGMRLGTNQPGSFRYFRNYTQYGIRIPS